jgi:hypothetical protein
MRRAAIAITLILCAAGCGGSEPDRASDPPEKPCPEGTELLAARDLLGRPPRGYEVVPPAEESGVDQFMAALKQGLGDSYRGHDAAVLVRRREREGALVLVVNADERSTSEGVLAGAQDAERENDLEGETIEVDGREGRLVRAADGSFLASAPAGECALVMLAGADEATVRHAASAIGGS